MKTTQRARRVLTASLSALLLAACQSTSGSEASTASPTNSGASSAAQGGPIAAEVAAANAKLDAIVALPASERTFENVVVAIDDVVAEFFHATRMRSFLSNVSTDAEERDLGRAASAAVSDWFSQLNKRKDLFRVVEAVAAAEPELNEAEAKLLETTLRDFRREGMALSDEERARLLALDKELNELGIEFRTNIAEDASKLYFTEEELAGCPEDFLKSLPRSADLYMVALTGPNYGPIFSYCTVPSTRLKTSTALGQRAPKNVDVLEKILKLRQEKAQLLGFQHTADYETEVRMTKSAATVEAFYDELRPKLREKALADFEEYQNAKREHTGDPEAELEFWDISFYKDWLLREKYAVDSQKVREYFPMDAVLGGLFSVTQELYGVEYKDITESARAAGRPVWHEDVSLYEVWDKADGELLGEFYLDLFPRPNKYNHAAQFPIHLRKRWSNGELTTPLVALVCNFTKPTEDKPSLLSHGEVRTFFHEFGHCLHSIFSKVDFANLSGTGVSRDFVEAPSQMFENWVWDADVLGSFTRHYESGEPLPRELLDSMVAAKNLGSGLSYEGQVYLGMMDMAFHTDDDGVVDTSAVRADVYAETRLFDPLEGSISQASFGHLVGYQAGYYGYLWSLVYASDMFSRFEQGGIMNTELGLEYRDKILSRGGTRDELSMVQDFLGREPNSDAFLRHLGLDGVSQ